jgi:hypothetical protein
MPYVHRKPPFSVTPYSMSKPMSQEPSHRRMRPNDTAQFRHWLIDPQRKRRPDEQIGLTPACRGLEAEWEYRLEEQGVIALIPVPGRLPAYVQN